MLNRISDYLPTTWNMARKPKSPDKPTSLRPSVDADAQSWSKSVEQFVRSHPGASLAAAFCIGVTVAWWIKRR